MKITIDASPEELAKLLSEFIYSSHKSYQEAEEHIGNLILSGIAKFNGKKENNTNDEEVPNGGYFH